MASMKDLEKALSKIDGNKDSSSPTGCVQIAVREIPEAPTPPIKPELDLTPPDGGAAAWIQVFNNVLVNTLAWGYPAAFGVFQLYYSETTLGQTASSSQISWIGSLQTFLCFLTCAPAGRLADAGYSRGTTIAGAVFLVLGTFMTSLCSKYWQILLAQGICTGIGLGFVYMPAVVVMTAYFSKNQALAMGLSGAGASIGSALFPAVVQYLIPAVGFAWAVRCLAFLFLGICLSSVFLIKPRLSPCPNGPVIDLTAFKEPAYALYAAGTFVIFLSTYFTTFYVSVYATQVLNFSNTTSILLLIVLSAVGIPARGIAGLLASSYLGPMNLYIVSNILLGITTLTWIAVRSQTDLWAFVVVYGLVNGFVQASFGGSLASLTTDPSKMGSRFGMVCTVLAFATLAGPPAAGAIIDAEGGEYLGAQIWAAGSMIAGALLVAAGRSRVTGWKLFVKV